MLTKQRKQKLKLGLPFNDTLYTADAYVIHLEVAVTTSRMAIEELVDFSPIRLGFSGGGRSMAKKIRYVSMAKRSNIFQQLVV